MLTVDVIVPEQQAGAHRILEADGERRRAIAAALETLAPVEERRLLVANLLSAVPTGLEGLAAAARSGGLVVGYAADVNGMSRVLGAVRCYADPPDAAEASSAMAALPRGARRIITLSEDVDAFHAAKGAWTKAGHSVSMACDAKQALDLMTIVTPDAVLVDVRSAPESAAEFISALAPEGGGVMLLLVYGARSGDALKRVLQRLLRPAALGVADLVRVCETVLQGQPTPAAAAARPVRALERPKVAPRKTVARRILPQRR
jgi:hypothetical protein